MERRRGQRSGTWSPSPAGRGGQPFPAQRPAVPRAFPVSIARLRHWDMLKGRFVPAFAVPVGQRQWQGCSSVCVIRSRCCVLKTTLCGHCRMWQNVLDAYNWLFLCLEDKLLD